MQSGYIYDKFRQRLVVGLYNGKVLGSEKCVLGHLKIDNDTGKIIRDIRLVIVSDWVTKRDDLDDFEFHYRADTMASKEEYKFIDRENLYIPYFVKNSILTIPKLNPGEWLDLTVAYRIHEDAEAIRSSFPKTSSEYFTPRIANASSEDGRATILHHRDTCLTAKFKPTNDSWRFWQITVE